MKYVIIDTKTGEFYHSNNKGTYFTCHLPTAYEFDSKAIAEHEMKQYTCFDKRDTDIITFESATETIY